MEGTQEPSENDMALEVVKRELGEAVFQKAVMEGKYTKLVQTCQRLIAENQRLQGELDTKGADAGEENPPETNAESSPVPEPTEPTADQPTAKQKGKRG